MLTKVN